MRNMMNCTTKFKFRSTLPTGLHEKYTVKSHNRNKTFLIANISRTPEEGAACIHREIPNFYNHANSVLP